MWVLYVNPPPPAYRLKNEIDLTEKSVASYDWKDKVKEYMICFGFVRSIVFYSYSLTDAL